MVAPAPSSVLASLRPDIKDAMLGFDVEMNQSKMIARRVFPVIETELQAGSFPKVTIEALMKNVDTARSSGGAYNFTEFDFKDDTFATKENGVTVPTDDRNSAIYSLFGLELVAAKLARSVVMINQERRVAALLNDTGTYTGNHSIVAWTSGSTAKPINDVERRVQSLYDAGVVANALIISWKTFRNLRNVQQIIDRITSSGAGNPAKPDDVTVQMLAQVFDLPNIIVGGAQYNSANDGQTASLSSIWSNNLAVVTRVASDGDSIEVPCCGRTFHWGGDGSTPDGTFETYYCEEIRGTKVRCRLETQEKVMYPTAIQLIDITQNDG